MFQQRGLSTYLLPSADGTGVILNGSVTSGEKLTNDRDQFLVAGGALLLFRLVRNPAKWTASVNPDFWVIRNEGASDRGPFPFYSLSAEINDALTRGEAFTRPVGSTLGLSAASLLPYLPESDGAASRERDDNSKPSSSSLNGSASDATPPPLPPAPLIDSEHGAFTCPVCWLRFDSADVMNVATHASLRGDSLLGEDHMQRFSPTRFNDSGQALDAMGIASPDIACPHCRRKLPPGFLEHDHHIFSIVGAPSSGKSYYLAILVRQLQSTLFREFGIAFRDADPSENALVNQMKNRLAGGGSPQDVYIAKTDLEGGMYETLPRLGRKVALPKPFVFQLSRRENGASQQASVIFYDNAGEHFVNRNSADSPGAQHIASASTIFFLFDPLNSYPFKPSLDGCTDPGAGIATDQQDIILAESEVRMKSILGLPTGQQVSTPFAFIVGKSEALDHLIPPSEIEQIVAEGHFDHAALDRNSARIRRVLFDIHPAIVANAESISSDVRYFAVSAFGSSPVKFTTADGRSMIGPDPAKISPRYIEHPTLWALSRIAPELFPAAK